MPDQELFVQAQIADGAPVECIVKPQSSMAPSDLNAQLAVTQLAAPVKVTRYLPRARQVQAVEPATGDAGAPAVRVQIAGRKQAFERWLVAGDPLRNRLTSLIGTWRYMAVADGTERDALLAQFENELTRDPQVLIATDDATPPIVLEAKPGASVEFAGGKQRVTVRAFMPHFGIDTATKEPANQSDKRINPAVRVEVTQNDRTESHWLFAKFPDFQAHGTEALPLQMRLDCPIEVERSAPDMVLVTVARERQEVWTRFEGRIATRGVDLHQPLEVPGSSYMFALAAFVPSGALIESYEPAADGELVTALRVELPGADGATKPVWLELGRVRVVDTPAGPLNLLFASRPSGTTQGG